jgi:hypothetical protein
MYIPGPVSHILMIPTSRSDQIRRPRAITATCLSILGRVVKLPSSPIDIPCRNPADAVGQIGCQLFPSRDESLSSNRLSPN